MELGGCVGHNLGGTQLRKVFSGTLVLLLAYSHIKPFKVSTDFFFFNEYVLNASAGCRGMV